MTDDDNTPIKVTYRGYPNERGHLFWYHPNRKSASVSYPDGHTSSESLPGEIEDEHVFVDYISSVVGSELPNETLSLFRYLLRKNIAAGHKDFTIEAAYLVSACLSDAEKLSLRKEAEQLDQQYYAKTGRRIDLTEFDSLLIVRHKPRANALLETFRELLAAS